MIQLRPSTKDDAGFLARARNSTVYRRWGLHGPTPLLAHTQLDTWLTGLNWVVEDDQGRVGFVRIDPADSPGGDVSIFILPRYQRQGYGAEALRLMRKLYPGSRALIRTENTKSRRAFVKAGYVFDLDQGDGVLCYKDSHK